MIGLARFMIMIVAVLTVLYVCLWLYFRAGKREDLRMAWLRDQPPLPQDTYIDVELHAYSKRLKRRLIVGIYVLPIAAIVALIYVTNFM